MMLKKYTALFVLLLYGCAYEWHHPIKNKDKFFADSESCEVRALQMYPRVMINKEVRAAYQSPAVTKCISQKNGETTCITAPGAFIPPEFRMADVNDNDRKEAAILCLKALGWRLEKKK